MKTLIKSALVIDPQSPHNGKRRDILLQDGKIVEIATNIEENRTQVIRGKGLCISPGWIDLKAQFCDPGFEYKEDMQSGIAAAKRGGFKTVVLMPSTLPVMDSKGAVEYILSKTKKETVNILPAGSLSEKMEGKQLSEMYDMHLSGAVAFTDDKKDVSTELMSRALEYSKNFGGLVMSFPYDRGVSPNGQIHEGPISVSLGMKGIPGMAEELRVQRDIELLRYNGGKLHFSLVSSAKSIELIRKAKKEVLQITCAVAAHQLSFIDENLVDFDSNYKVLPPFRSKDDKRALIAGLKDGTIDAICSDHTPEDVEHKVREFEDAQFGICGIETAFCAAFTALEKHLSIEAIIQKLSDGPAAIIGRKCNTIATGGTDDITVFSTEENTVFDKAGWKSKSMNSPFLDSELRGHVYDSV